MNLLITGAIKKDAQFLDDLKEKGYNTLFIKEEREEIEISEKYKKNIKGIICNSFFLYNDIREFESLEFIQLTSAGTDRVPLDYIRKHNIKLFTAKNVYTIPMAEWTIWRLLDIYKESKSFHLNQINKNWEKKKDLEEISGKTALIIGYGNVGEEIAKRLKSFNVKIIAVARTFKNSIYIDEFSLSKDLESILPKADIIISVLPLNNETQNYINRKMINLMKRDSVLINLSRGQVIDEMALIEALRDEKFKGVGLDVFHQEPLDAKSELWDFDRVYITPHNSYASVSNDKRLFKLIIHNLEEVKKVGE